VLTVATGGRVELDEGVVGDSGINENGVEGVTSGYLDAGGEGAVVGCWFGSEHKAGVMGLVVREE